MKAKHGITGYMQEVKYLRQFCKVFSPSKFLMVGGTKNVHSLLVPVETTPHGRWTWEKFPLKPKELPATKINPFFGVLSMLSDSY